MFINSDGTIIYSYPGSTSLPQTYKEHIDKALIAAGEGRRIGELEKEYKAGNRYPGFVEFLLKTKESLSLETDSLLNEYVSNLPPDSFNSIRTLQFIASMAPLIGSSASNKMRQNRMLFDRAWYSMYLQERISINRRIGYKSMQKAINEKNIQYANQVASFIRNTYDNNAEAGQKAYESKMVEFYRETNDTANYLIRAANYFDTYFMTASVDSIKLKDKIYTNSQIEKQPIINDSQKMVKRIIIYSPSAQMFTRELNNGAYSFYKFTNDPLLLNKALQWSTRANEFTENYIALDTHAHLLYKLGRKAEAIIWQQKAINLKKKQGYNTESLEKELGEMNNGTLRMQ